MLASRLTTRDLVRRVAKLPEEYMVRRIVDHWAVVGPTGIFVVGRAEGDLTAAALHTSTLANRLRQLLSESVSWVPFVDALVVGQSGNHDLECAVVDPEMLEAVLTQGPPRLDLAGMHDLKRALPGIAMHMQAGV